MTLDPRFIVTSDLESYFVDKDSGAPLAAGIVTFYSDINRITKKPVYQLTGSPPNYTYSALPNPSILSGVGTFQDESGNNIVPYYFPYQGTPDDSDGTIELYYITVQNMDEVDQFTREGWPNVTSSGNLDNEGFRNFIPNGQFITHTDSPPVIEDTATNTDIYYYAQGGFSFRRTHGGASVFDNTFTRITGGVSGLDDFPRYAFNFNCISFSSSDQVRDIMWQWPGINQFSSGNPPGSQAYTFTVSAQSNDSNTYTFDVRLIRNYGTGGSPSSQVDTSIGTFVITPAYAVYSLNIGSIPVAAGNLGTNNDDYVGIALRGPAGSFNIQTTDYSQLIGTVQPDFFPVQTDADMKARGVAGWMPIPNPDGSDLYLPLVLTPKGMQFDHSQIGEITPIVNYIADFTDEMGAFTPISTTGNSLTCTGDSYPTAAYSPLGIPYARLQAKLFNEATGECVTGTGPDFVMSYLYAGVTNALRITTNVPGAQTVSANGVISPTFTITTLFTGSTAYEAFAYVIKNAHTLYVISSPSGVATAANAGTSGFIVAQLLNAPSIRSMFSVDVNALPAAGTYFTFDIPTIGSFYVWFTVNGVGANPTPGGTGILVPILSSYTTQDVTNLIREAIAGFQTTNIVTVAASSIPAGAYFTFNTYPSYQWTVWYEVGGSGSSPVVDFDIKVTLSGTETAAQVAQATRLAINRHVFATPNLTAATLRGWNNGAAGLPDDPGTLERFGLTDNAPFSTSTLASYQYYQMQQHFHMYDKSDSPITNFISAGPVESVPVESNSGLPVINFTETNTTYSGGNETRPFNYSVLFTIKY
jgi:hypothetical protein